MFYPAAFIASATMGYLPILGVAIIWIEYVIYCKSLMPIWNPQKQMGYTKKPTPPLYVLFVALR